jgi:hypothetical protein
VNVFAGITVPPPDAPPPVGYVMVEPPPVWGAPVSPAPPRTEAAVVSLPPPPPLEVDRRGFFDGDSLRLELVVVDRRTGAPLWTKVVEGALDPRDAAAVERLLYGALADSSGWEPTPAQAVAR